MKRDGSLDWYSPKMRRRAAPVSDQRRARPRHADVTEPALLLELLLVFASSASAETGLLSRPARIDDREFEALGAVQRHQPDARVARALFLVRRPDSSDSRSTKPPSDGSAARGSRILARGRHELGEVLDARLRRPRFAHRADPAGSRSDPSILPIAIDTGFVPRDLGQRDDQVAKRRRAMRRRGRETRRSSRPRTMRAQSELADSAGCRPAREQRQVGRSSAAGVDVLDRRP